MNSIIRNSINNIRRTFFINILFTVISIFLFLSSAKIWYNFNNKKFNLNYNTMKIFKKKSMDNIFLFDGSIGNVSIISDEISNMYKAYDVRLIEPVVSFPVGVVLRTASAQSRVYAYQDSVLEDGSFFSNSIIAGEMFAPYSNRIVIGVDLAEAIGVAEGDVVSLLARASRGWLETGYFTISGIYDLGKSNYDIYTDMHSASNFIYLRNGRKSPYLENIIVFFETNVSKAVDLFKNSKIADINDLSAVYIKNEDAGFIPYHIEKAGLISFLIILTISMSCIVCAFENMQFQKMANSYEDKLLLKSTNIFQIIIFSLLGIVISLYIIYFMEYNIRIIFYSLCTVIVSFIISILMIYYRRFAKINE